MTKLRNIFMYLMMPLLFIWYIGGINLFPHTHIIGGVTVVHSHPFAGAEHQSEDNMQTIDMLCHYYSDAHPDGVELPSLSGCKIVDVVSGETSSICLQDVYTVFSLRGPPQK